MSMMAVISMTALTTEKSVVFFLARSRKRMGLRTMAHYTLVLVLTNQKPSGKIPGQVPRAEQTQPGNISVSSDSLR